MPTDRVARGSVVGVALRVLRGLLVPRAYAGAPCRTWAAARAAPAGRPVGLWCGPCVAVCGRVAWGGMGCGRRGVRAA